MLLESENRDVRPLMPSILKSLQLPRKLHRSFKPFILLLKLSVGKNIPPLALVPLIHKLLSVTLKEAEGDSSLIKQVKAAVSRDLEEQYQDDDIQKSECF